MPKAIKRIHLRIAIGGAILMVALFCWIFLLGGMTYVAGVIPGGVR